jgi:hypothetical protein
LDVAVACAKNRKFAAVNEDERYDGNVVLSGLSSSRERKYGMALIMTIQI